MEQKCDLLSHEVDDYCNAFYIFYYFTCQSGMKGIRLLTIISMLIVSYLVVITKIFSLEQIGDLLRGHKQMTSTKNKFDNLDWLHNRKDLMIFEMQTLRQRIY